MLKQQFEANEARLARMDAVLRARQQEKERIAKAKLLARNSEPNLQRLESMVQTQKHKLRSLVDEWEHVRVALESEWNANNAQVEHKRKIHLETETMKQELKQILARIRRPHVTSESTRESASSSSERALVIARVLDSTKQISKQRIEINQLQSEIAGIAKEVTFSSEQLGEIERDTDEIVFAESTDNALQVFEFLVELVERFDMVMQLEETALQTSVACWEKRTRVARLKSSMT